MMWLLHSHLPEIFLKLFLSFLWACFQLTLSNLQACFKFPSSLLEVPHELTFLEAPFQLASFPFELHIGCILLMSFLQGLISLSLKLPLSLLQALWLPSSFLSACFSSLSAYLEFASVLGRVSFRLPFSFLCASLKNHLELCLRFLCASLNHPSSASNKA